MAGIFENRGQVGDLKARVDANEIGGGAGVELDGTELQALDHTGVRTKLCSGVQFGFDSAFGTFLDTCGKAFDGFCLDIIHRGGGQFHGELLRKGRGGAEGREQEAGARGFDHVASAGSE